MKKTTKAAALLLSLICVTAAVISCSARRAAAKDGYLILRELDSRLLAAVSYNDNHNYYLDSARDDYFPALKRILPARLVARSFSFNNSANHSAEFFESVTEYTSADDYVCSSLRSILMRAEDRQDSCFDGKFTERTQKARLNAVRTEDSELYRQAVSSLETESAAMREGNYFYGELMEMFNFFEDGGGINLLENASFTQKRGIYTAKLKTSQSAGGITLKKSIILTFDRQRILSAEVKVLSYRGKEFVTGRRDKLIVSYKSGIAALPSNAMDYRLID